MNFEKKCPHPDRNGRHEVYAGAVVRYQRGHFCKACGGSEVSEIDLMEAVIACAVRLTEVAERVEWSTIKDLEAAQQALYATSNALKQHRAQKTQSTAREILVVRHPAIGAGPKDAPR